MSFFTTTQKITLPFLSLTISAILYTPHASAADEEFKPWQVRAGISLISPTSDSGSIANDAINVTIDNRVGPTVNLAYFFTPNWSVDVLGGLPFKHQINFNGSRAGETKHLPPIVSLQYHFNPEGKLSPFIGVGVNYTKFLSEKADNGAKVELSDSWGPAVQFGLDYALNKEWSIGGDIRYAKINTDVRINGQKLGDVDVDPTIYSLNVGYRF